MALLIFGKLDENTLPKVIIIFLKFASFDSFGKIKILLTFILLSKSIISQCGNIPLLFVTNLDAVLSIPSTAR